MTTKELYNYLNERIPAELSEDWDNDGRMLISSDREIKRVLISLDVTGETVSKAVKESFDLIITHHPLIFKPVKGITDERFLTLIKADISVFSFHTRLDAVEGGVNDALASLLGLKNTEAFEEMGRIGELDKEMTAEEFAHFVKNTLGAPLVNFTDSEKKIKRAALLGGGGKDFWQAASAEVPISSFKWFTGNSIPVRGTYSRTVTVSLLRTALSRDQTQTSAVPKPTGVTRPVSLTFSTDSSALSYRNSVAGSCTGVFWGAI